MKKLRKRKNFTAGMLLCAIVGAVLRLFAPMQVILLFVAAVGVFAAFVLRGLKPRADFAPNHRPSLLTLLILPAALMMAVGTAVRAIPPAGTADLIRGTAGVIAAVCLGCFGVFAVGRKKPPLASCALQTLSMGVLLIVDFRAWSVDPRIGDYMFALFYTICAALLSLHLGSFVLGCGKRRFAAWCCAVGTVCAAITAIDGGLARVLQGLAWVLVFLAEAWSLLTPGRKRKMNRTAPETETAEKHEDPKLPEPEKPADGGFDLTGEFAYLTGSEFPDGLNLDEFRY